MSGTVRGPGSQRRQNHSGNGNQGRVVVDPPNRKVTPRLVQVRLLGDSRLCQVTHHGGMARGSTTVLTAEAMGLPTVNIPKTTASLLSAIISPQPTCAA